jgi:hypothetical protein
MQREDDDNAREQTVSALVVTGKRERRDQCVSKHEDQPRQPAERHALTARHRRIASRRIAARPDAADIRRTLDKRINSLQPTDRPSGQDARPLHMSPNSS